MGFFRRRPLHERLLAADKAPLEWEPAITLFAPNLDPAAVHGNARRREWDVLVTAVAPAAKGDAVRFVVVEGGDLIVEEGDDSGDLAPLADAVEQSLKPPYRAQAVRQKGDMFAVGAIRIEVVELPAAGADSVTLTVNDGSRELQLDGERVFGGLPALERIGERAGRDYVVRAQCIDGELFEVEVTPL